MELLKDLGTRIRKSGGTYRWGLYKCPQCAKEYELAISTVNYRKRVAGANTCRACANVNTANTSRYAKSKFEATKASYLDTFSKAYGNRYDYSKFIYEGAWSKSTIICEDHGEFLQAYADHREGHGCPHCANEESTYGLRNDFVLSKPTKVYYLYLPEYNLWKIGCTSNSLAKRFIEDKHITIEVLHLVEYSTGYEAYAIEKYLLHTTVKNRYSGEAIMKGGNSELRTQPVENLAYFIRKAERLYNTLEEDYINH